MHEAAICPAALALVELSANISVCLHEICRDKFVATGYEILQVTQYFQQPDVTGHLGGFTSGSSGNTASLNLEFWMSSLI